MGPVPVSRRIPLRYRHRVLGRYAELLQAAVARREMTETEATERLTRAVATR
jgi:hypothetical protein